jgi:uncharacterized membrane protein
MMLIVSILLGLIPLLGIAYTVVNGGGLTIDNLFLVLVLLTISGVFLLNAALELRRRRRAKPAAAKAADTAPAAQTQVAGKKAG